MISWGRDRRTVNALQYCFQWVTCRGSKAEVQTWTFEGLGQRVQSKNLIVDTKQLMLKREETLSKLQYIVYRCRQIEWWLQQHTAIVINGSKNVTLNPHKDCFATVVY